MPVKKYLSKFLADLKDEPLKETILNMMISDLSKDASSQVRQVFMLYLESLIPQTTCKYFKLNILPSYFALGEDKVVSMLLGYVRMACDVRMRLHSYQNIERLELSLMLIKMKH